MRSEAELAPKREVPPGEATALEALLRGDSLLEKKNNICKEEETLLEIQNRGSSRRRTEPVNADDQDKPYVCDSKRDTRTPPPPPPVFRFTLNSRTRERLEAPGSGGTLLPFDLPLEK
ncbi:Zinc finger protein DPF3 [Liparis tanakae]|uniref:Zinc finger protein DPF3 n=1 Tax=Liparis tanakae TaxID=230148 RepID=A0A4Z2G2K3_9TELE|nr:Zinc finger protein DPF3 [Liparis tanakae]